MAKIFSVSLCEKELIQWLEEQKAKGELSPSLLFRDAVSQKKQEWDIMYSENPALLKKKVDDLKKTIGKQSEFIGKDKKRQEEWFDFFENYENHKPTLQIETIEEKEIVQENSNN